MHMTNTTFIWQYPNVGHDKHEIYFVWHAKIQKTICRLSTNKNTRIITNKYNE